MSSLLLSNAGTGPVIRHEAGTNYHWTIATFGSVTNPAGGFSSDMFTVDTTGSSFANGSFNLTVNLDTINNSLYLAPVPEPTGILALSAATAGLVGSRSPPTQSEVGRERRPSDLPRRQIEKKSEGFSLRFFRKTVRRR